MLDPVWTTATVSRNHGYLVFDTLYGQDDGYRIQPQMVAGHTVEQDGLLWRLTLREGLLFHDGTPVRAQDVPCPASVRRFAARDAFGQRIDGRDGRAVRRVGPGGAVPLEAAVPAAAQRARQEQARRCRASCRNAWP